MRTITILISLLAAAAGFYFLREMFIGELAIPRVIPLGPFELRLYSLTLLMGALAGYALLQRQRDMFGFLESEVDSLFFICILTGIIGARLHHVASDWSYYQTSPDQIAAIWRGGLGLYGGVAGGAVGAAVWAVWHGKIFLAAADFLAPALALAQAIGRWGNFFNQEAYGTRTETLWKMFVAPSHRMGDAAFYHPLFLYESLWDLLVFMVVWRLTRRSAASGSTVGWYLILYSAGRFLLEQLRAEPTLWHNLRLNQLLALVVIVLGLTLVVGANGGLFYDQKIDRV